MKKIASIGRRQSREQRITRTPKRWQLQDAKARFSEVFAKALDDGPQVVTRRNKQAVVILAENDYKKLKHAWKMPSLVEALLAMPKVRGFNIPERDKSDTVPLDRPVFD